MEVSVESKTLYILDYVKLVSLYVYFDCGSSIQSYASLVFECMLPGRCSPGKRCHTFWNRNIVLSPILLGKVSCVPKHTLYELYVVKFWEGLA